MRRPLPCARRGRVLLTVAVAVTLLGVTACGMASPGSSPGPTPAAAPTVDPTLTVERRVWGGLCRAGACESRLLVHGTGEWTLEDPEAPGRGELDEQQLSELAEAMATTRVGEPLPEGDCPPAYDGQAVDYRWEDPSGSGEWSTCGSVVDEEDPLVRWLDSLAADVEG